MLGLTDTTTNLTNPFKLGHALESVTNLTVSICVDLRERTKTIRRHGDRWGQIADFWDSFERIKCGATIKTNNLNGFFDPDPHQVSWT